MAKKQRLDKAIAMQGALSRSEVKSLIRKGEVTVNGQVVKSADFGVDFDSDTIAVQGRELTLRQHLYLMMNKPKGVVSASEDRHERTVVDLVPERLFRKGLFPAGRLDKDTTGFVLLTDDGAFAHDILAPGRHVSKEYIVTLDTPLTPAMQAGFAAGVTLADGQTMDPAEAEPWGADPCVVKVTLHQGVYHQIKRMFGVYGAGVNGLHRTAIGPVALDQGLEPGCWRPLTTEEVEALRRASRG